MTLRLKYEKVTLELKPEGCIWNYPRDEVEDGVRQVFQAQVMAYSSPEMKA